MLLSTIAVLPDEELPGLSLRLLLTVHIAFPRDGAVDYLEEAEATFALKKPMKPQIKAEARQYNAFRTHVHP